MVGIKLAVVLFVIVVGAFYVDPANWRPFAPFGLVGNQLLRQDGLRADGAGGAPLGMLAGAAIIFFAYIGFDSVSTHCRGGEEPAARRSRSASSLL